MKISVGLVDFANLAANYAKGFRALGHEPYTVVFESGSFYKSFEYDFVVDGRINRLQADSCVFRKIPAKVRRRLLLATQFLKTLRTSNLCIFIYGTSFLPGHLDYPILKLFGKRIVSVFLGDDVRYPCAYEQEMTSLGLDSEIQPFLEYCRAAQDRPYSTKIKRVRSAERYADLILSQPSMHQLQRRPYMRMNIPLDLSEFRFHLPCRERPLLLHAPSDRKVKGTEIILKAVEQLKKEGFEFEFRLIEKTPNHLLRRWLSEADIVVDQIYSDTLATLALEAMASGNAVLSRYLPVRSRIPLDCPVINVNCHTLVARLREVITDQELRLDLARKGRTYVQAHHSHLKVAQEILDWLEPEGIQEYDFTPTFFQKEFRVPHGLIREERKRLIRHYHQSLKKVFSSTERRNN